MGPGFLPWRRFAAVLFKGFSWRRVRRAAEALEYAQRLQALYGPPMDPRTRYCLEQNPQVREALRSGTLDPVRDLAGLVDRLRAQARRRAG